MKKPLIHSTAWMVVVLGAACSDGRSVVGELQKEPPNESEALSEGLAPDAHVIGTAKSVLEGVTRSARGGMPEFALLNSDGQAIALAATDYYFDGASLSMTGGASVDPDASFILKGNSSDIYGWIVLPRFDVAYEYTTNGRGEVIVTSVPVTKIYPICDDDAEGVPEPDHEQAAPGMEPDPPHVGPYNNQDTNKLQSLPGATKVLFMDLAVLTLPKAEIWKAWQTVAGSYSAFNVNVTTDRAVYEATPAMDRGRGCYNDAAGRSSCSLNAFGTSRCCTIYNKGNGYYEGTTSAHELGHLMGLSHDGSPAGAYFGGFSAFRWCPIMGSNPPKTSWGDQALFQWSKGEYSGANQTQDDLAIMSRKLSYRPDDIASSKALTVQAGAVSSDFNRGQIASNTDTDTFTFRIGSMGGHATLTIDRIEFVGGAYLDVDAKLLDGAGMQLAQSNDKVARTAKFDLDLMPGDYSIVIAGGAEGTPANGFSNYSSLGFYGISGTIRGAIDGGGTGGAGGMGGAGGSVGAGGAAGSAGRGGAGGLGGSGGSAGGSAGAGGMAGRGGAAGSGDVGGSAGSAGSSAGAGGQVGTPDAGEADSGRIGSGGAGGGSTGTNGIPPAKEPPNDAIGGCSCSSVGARASLRVGWWLVAVAALGVFRRRAVGRAGPKLRRG